MKDKRLLVIFCTVFIDLVGFGIIIPMNPYLAKSFNATPQMVGVLMSVYSLMQFLFSPIWGQLSDRIGRRPVILVSLLGASIAHLSFAFATSLTGLILARAFAGLFGGNISTAMAYIADVTDEKDRSKGMGLVGAAFGLGFILGPLLGGLFSIVGQRLGDQPPLGQSFPAVIAGGIAFLNFLTALKYLPESRRPGIEVRRHGGRFRRVGRALATPVLGVLMLLTFMNSFAMAHMEASLFLYVQDAFGWSLGRASLGFGYIGVIMTFTQGYFIRKLMPRFGEPAVMITGLILSGVGFGLIGLSGNIALLALAVTALGFGNGFTNPALSGGVSLLSDPSEQGNNLGVAQSLSSLARILGPVTGGWLYQNVGVWSPFAGASILALGGAGLALTVRAQLPAAARGRA